MTILREDHAPFSVQSESRDHAAYLHLSGDLDMATSPVLDVWLSGVESNGTTGIVLDLENVKFIDSSGVRSFLRATDRAGRSGRSLAIVNAPAVVRKIFQLTQTLHLLAGPPPDAPGSEGSGSTCAARSVQATATTSHRR